MKIDTPTHSYIIYSYSVLLVILAGFLIYGYFMYSGLKEEHQAMTQELANTQTTLQSKEFEAGTLGMTLEEIKQAYALSEENGIELLAELNEEKEKNDAFEKQIGKISGTVGKLDKLSKMDPELLIKYSKVYFLNENYVPAKVVAIDGKFTLNKDYPEFINSQVEPFLSNLFEDAEADGVSLLVVSGYRSYDEQKGLKGVYTTQYGSGANAFSADQGYSEHQLGTTLDFTSNEIGGGLSGFDTTKAYTWLQENAYKYGFVLSYPKDNGFYIFEPWHWRFVGQKLAGDLNDDGKFFYDLDQRDIDKYLISLFD
ncbi:MAG: M15 family metallopeptidase [Minisyncoccia bacterium]